MSSISWAKRQEIRRKGTAKELSPHSDPSGPHSCKIPSHPFHEQSRPPALLLLGIIQFSPPSRPLNWKEIRSQRIFPGHVCTACRIRIGQKIIWNPRHIGDLDPLRCLYGTFRYHLALSFLPSFIFAPISNWIWPWLLLAGLIKSLPHLFSSILKGRSFKKDYWLLGTIP